VPLPVRLTCSGIKAEKCTLTDRASLIVTVHVVPVPVHAPDHVVK
jgi:hypothetical protein